MTLIVLNQLNLKHDIIPILSNRKMNNNNLESHEEFK